MQKAIKMARPTQALKSKAEVKVETEASAASCSVPSLVLLLLMARCLFHARKAHFTGMCLFYVDDVICGAGVEVGEEGGTKKKDKETRALLPCSAVADGW